jgi:predicted secreted hydrolase
MTHLALTDVNGQRFQFTERMNRAGPGWAGADVGAYRVWNEDWEATIDATRTHRLRASDGGYGIDLQLEEGRPPALHGDRGYSRKDRRRGTLHITTRSRECRLEAPSRSMAAGST